MFYGDGLVREWKAVLSQASDNCGNLMCVNHTFHSLWTAGYFALKPLRQSEDGTEIDVEWHWLPKVMHRPHDHVPLTTPPPSTEGLTISGGAVVDLGRVEGPESNLRMFSPSEQQIRKPCPCRILPFWTCNSN